MRHVIQKSKFLIFLGLLLLLSESLHAKLRFFPEDSVLLRSDVGEAKITGFFIHNLSSDSLQIKGVKIEGPGAEYFHIDQNTCENESDFSLQENDICYVIIEFIPEAPSDGLEGFIAYLKVFYVSGQKAQLQQIMATLIGYAYSND